MPVTRITNSTGQSIPNNTMTQCTFNTIVTDDLNVLFGGAPYTQFTVNTTGNYFITGTASFGTGAVGYRQMNIEVLHTVSGLWVVMASQYVSATGAGYKSLEVGTMLRLYPNDTVRLTVIQTNGAALTLSTNSTANGTPDATFAIALITPQPSTYI